MSVEERVTRLFDLYKKWGSENYIGEKVSQLQHAQQAALQAEQAGEGPEVVLGAFLHDIGHIVGLEENLPAMFQDGLKLGTVDHDVVGEAFLRDMGFPASITQFVRGHVQAKRYLVYKYPEYHDKLTDASKGTLKCQGGPMTEEEAIAFEKLPNFQAILSMRGWDEQAKDTSIPVASNQSFVDIATKILHNNV